MWHREKTISMFGTRLWRIIIEKLQNLFAKVLFFKEPNFAKTAAIECLQQNIRRKNAEIISLKKSCEKKEEKICWLTRHDYNYRLTSKITKLLWKLQIYFKNCRFTSKKFWNWRFFLEILQLEIFFRVFDDSRFLN